ncbi:hypothetical protein EVAR_90345_1 [Eumeta japonica]|uniref:Uncharacterized protein n=1 Tax=Eumeta variegata TaxID=151549 RepID=A0A4C1YG94_EUMVA|nr:hypothetical protein EVAR_90345_1 [Eumeta japonica]
MKLPFPARPRLATRQARGLWRHHNAIIQLNMEDSTFDIDYDDCEHSEFESASSVVSTLENKDRTLRQRGGIWAASRGGAASYPPGERLNRGVIFRSEREQTLHYLSR